MILEGLENDWPLAKDLKRFLLLDKFDNEAITQLTQILKQTIHTVQKTETREKMEQSIKLLEDIQKIEGESRLQDQVDVQELENALQDL